MNGGGATLRSLQALRALAALLVVALHALATLRAAGRQSALADAIGPYGHVGVDIFFVLSGLLMVATTAHAAPGLASAGAFLRARLRRIVPLYWLLTSAKVALLVLVPGMLLGARPADAWHILASYLFLPAYGPDGQAVPVLYQGWTLHYEMFFYAAFAALLCITRRRLVAALSLAFLALAALAPYASGLVGHFYTDSLLLEFLFGCWLGALYVRGWTLPAPAALVSAGLALALVLWQGAGLPRGLQLGMPAALLVAACLSLERRGAWPRMAVLERIGDSSYALYLSHIFVQSLLLRLLLRPGVLQRAPGDLLFVLITAACAVAAWVLYRLVERPLDRMLRAGSISKPSPCPTSKSDKSDRIAP
jgi:peptidoglycan/LPS O-acetylase OafA/YrhL